MKNQCPNPSCGSYDTKAPRKQYVWGGLLFAVLSLPWIFILIGIPFLIASLSIFIYGLTIGSDVRVCKTCKLKYSVNENGLAIFGE